MRYNMFNAELLTLSVDTDGYWNFNVLTFYTTEWEGSLFKIDNWGSGVYVDVLWTRQAILRFKEWWKHG